MTCEIYGDVCCFGICDCPHENDGCEMKIKRVMKSYNVSIEELIAKKYEIDIGELKELLETL